MLIRDSAKAVTRQKTKEGFLRVHARIGRAGVHVYQASDLGPASGLPPDTTVRVYRPPEEVFDPASMASFADVPVTQDHPPVMIDAANWKRFAVGHAGLQVARDGEHLATDLTITDADAVARAENGAELSNGYWADFVFGKGMTAGGEPYDAVQRNIRGNHIALVDQGRCGPSCRIDATVPGGDAAQRAVSHQAAGDCAGTACHCTHPCNGDPDMSETRTVTIDGIAIETTPEGALALGRLAATLDESRAAHRRAIEARDGEIAALRTRLPDERRLDALVAERAAVVEAARRVLGTSFDTAGQSTALIRRAAVTKVLGAERLKERSDDYVVAAFDMLVAAAPSRAAAWASPVAFGPAGAAGFGPAGQSLATQVAAGLTDGVATRDSALAARNAYLAQAWKGHNTGAA